MEGMDGRCTVPLGYDAAQVVPASPVYVLNVTLNGTSASTTEGSTIRGLVSEERKMRTGGSVVAYKVEARVRRGDPVGVDPKLRRDVVGCRAGAAGDADAVRFVWRRLRCGEARLGQSAGRRARSAGTHHKAEKQRKAHDRRKRTEMVSQNPNHEPKKGILHLITAHPLTQPCKGLLRRRILSEIRLNNANPDPRRLFVRRTLGAFAFRGRADSACYA